jgi:hypothetical protein
VRCALESKRSKVRHPLDTLAGVIAETAKVYREMRDNKLDHGKGRSLVWVLSQLRAMVETQALERLEQRLEELAPNIEGRGYGHTGANRPPRAAH